MLHIKNISCRQNQDNTAPKKIFCAQKSFFFSQNGAPSLNHKPRELTSTADAGGLTTTKLLSISQKKPAKIFEENLISNYILEIET